ncbi:MAG: 30S ribosomal protein S1 [Bifidobacteriaceae bacterium]|jgi:small subunit ribosomal protein S1|nr:30S ribosomal protein S1 [Bifidobacteriaceae bacterium]
MTDEKTAIAVNDIGTEDDLLKLIQNTVKSFKDGDLVTGKVVRIERDEVYIDLGYKTEGFIPQRELSIKPNVDPYDVVKIGEELECLVLEKEDDQGRLLLSKKRAQTERAWVEIEKRKKDDDRVIGEVIDIVRGGLIVDIGIRGFLPTSLVETHKVFDLQPYLGQTLEMKVVELDKARSNVILSRKDWLQQHINEKREVFFKTLEVGQIRKGKIGSVVTFGVFVDLGDGVDGLVHLSQLSWKHIVHPSDVVKIGEEVTVEVIEIDRDTQHVSLSIKSTQANPWQEFARSHVIGQIVEGTVRKIVAFGAFVDLNNDIEGLIHISELSYRRVQSTSHVLKPGDRVFAKITDIDLDERRISLSLRQANESIDISSEEFDPSLYGMVAEYDEEGNYKFPEGFDPETNQWMVGFETQRQEWEDEYAKAHALWLAHREQVERFNLIEAGETPPTELKRETKTLGQSIMEKQAQELEQS